MKRSKFPGNKQTKLTSAIARLEARTKLSDAELQKTAKSARTFAASFSIQGYREQMNTELAHLKTLVK